MTDTQVIITSILIITVFVLISLNIALLAESKRPYVERCHVDKIVTTEKTQNQPAPDTIKVVPVQPVPDTNKIIPIQPVPEITKVVPIQPTPKVEPKKIEPTRESRNTETPTEPRHDDDLPDTSTLLTYGILFGII